MEVVVDAILNALYYKRLFSESELKEVAEALEAYSFTLYPLRGEYAEKTIETAFENNITIYDSSYITLAMIKNTHMYTADEKLTRRLKKTHLKHVKNIKEE